MVPRACPSRRDRRRPRRGPGARPGLRGRARVVRRCAAVAGYPRRLAGEDRVEPSMTTALEGRSWRRLSIGLLLLLGAVMFATVLDYGMTGDEGVQHRYGRKLLRWYATLGADPSAQPEGDI